MPGLQLIRLAALKWRYMKLTRTGAGGGNLGPALSKKRVTSRNPISPPNLIKTSGLQGSIQEGLNRSGRGLAAVLGTSILRSVSI